MGVGRPQKADQRNNGVPKLKGMISISFKGLDRPMGRGEDGITGSRSIEVKDGGLTSSPER